MTVLWYIHDMTIWKITVIGAQNTTNNGHAYTSAGCTGGNTPSGSNSSGSAGGMQNGNYYGLPAGQQPCTFSYSGVAAQTYLNTGNAPSWNTWLNKRNTGYNNVGCRHFTNVTKWISNQLASGVNAAGNPWNPIQVARKNEKIAWANSMWDNCQCTQPGGSLPEELGRTYKINENKINLRKKFTKNKLKNIIREELKSSLLNEQYSGEGCESYLATTTPECQKCTSSQPTPYIPPAFGANNTGPQCQCCDDERVRDPHTGDKPNCNPELQHLDNYGIDCWWCPHEQVGGSSSCAVITSSTLSLALSSGQTLHTDSTLCAADTTTPCGEHSGGDDLDCQCCNGQFGQSMSPIPASTPGGCSSLNGYPLHSCSTQGTPLKCKKPPTRGGSEEPVGHTVGESQRLREEIQKELFGKK